MSESKNDLAGNAIAQFGPDLVVRHKKSAKLAQRILAVVAVINFGAGFYKGFGPDPSKEAMYAGVGIGIFYILLFFNAENKPRSSLFTGFIAYLLIIAASLASNPENGMEGIAVHVVIGIVMLVGLGSSKKFTKEERRFIAEQKTNEDS